MKHLYHKIILRYIHIKQSPDTATKSKLRSDLQNKVKGFLETQIKLLVELL